MTSAPAVRSATGSASVTPRTTALTGVGPLFRLALGRDKWRLLAWVSAVVLLALSSYLTFHTVFPDAQAQRELTISFGSNPALSLLTGSVHDLTSPGGFTAWRSLGFGSLAVGLMVIFTVVRHTRAEEDAGRTELVASGVVGRLAPLAAAVLLGLAATVATAVALFVSLTTASLADGAADPAGALAFALATGLVGLVFTSVAAVTAQIGSFSRTANSLACGVLALLYVLRGWGTVTSGMRWIVWGSPFGWSEEMLPYVENRWAILVLPIVSSAILLLLAHSLQSQRDMGSGLLTARPGAASASVHLAGPAALSWRLNRGPVIGWLVGFILLGALYGSVSSSMDELAKDSPALTKIITAGGDDAFTLGYLGMIITVLALMATLHGVQTVLRGRTEEVEGRAEPILATSVSRSGWFASHALVGMASSGLVYLAGVVAFSALTMATVPGTTTFTDLLIAGLVQILPLWVLVAVAAFLFGLFPRLVLVSWAAIALTFVMALFGPALGLPDFWLNLSVFNHIPNYLADGFHGLPVAILSGIVIALVTGGFVGIKRRDLGH
jgi:ABC-2 type transport system permease protein